MNDVAAVGWSYDSRAIRRLLLAVATLCIVGGSQLGMLILAGVYLHADRAVDRTSPEALAGMIAIALAMLVVRVRSSVRYRNVVTLWLICFLAAAALGELLRADVRLGNVSTFISIGAFYLIGIAVGRDAAKSDPLLPLLPWLLLIYTIWYLWLAVFMARGDLGFFGGLPGTELGRLQFASGYTATELPIYVGLQLPILIYATLAGPAAIRLWAMFLSGCALITILASVSFGALAGTSLVMLIFVLAYRGFSWRSLLRSLGLLVIVIAIAVLVSSALVDSVREKVETFAIGEGIRALLYSELITDIVETPFGIGKGRFAESNNFGPLGEGVYPHQNLLGIGAELGIPALLLFIGFLLAAIAALVRAGLSSRDELSNTSRLFVATVLAIFVYQQFRGLFQDTWVIRETYFWLGMGMGVISSHTATLARTGFRHSS